jgi:hypothetical protein
VNSGGQGAGDGTRTRDIQLGRHIRGFVFGLRRRRRLGALIHLTAVGRTSVAPDLGSLNGTTASQWSSRQPVRHPVEKARSLMPDLRVPAGLPRFPPEPSGAAPERHDQHDPRHCAAGRRQESFRNQAAAKEHTRSAKRAAYHAPGPLARAGSAALTGRAGEPRRSAPAVCGPVRLWAGLSPASRASPRL